MVQGNQFNIKRFIKKSFSHLYPLLPCDLPLPIQFYQFQMYSSRYFFIQILANMNIQFSFPLAYTKSSILRILFGISLYSHNIPWRPVLPQPIYYHRLSRFFQLHYIPLILKINVHVMFAYWWQGEERRFEMLIYK